MRAEICDATDNERLERFKALLRELEAVQTGAGEAMGVDLVSARIGPHEIQIFSDAWSVDIEGPPEIVAVIVGRMGGDEKRAGDRSDRA
jgi:hypothetical protein